MQKLVDNFKTYLPVNRKERFFTGTVLPQIICCDNFKEISRFLKLIRGFPKNLIIKSNASENNIQFLTEFSLKESLVDGVGSREYLDVPVTKETPDIVILITDPELFLIVIEAKMFSSIQPHEFRQQLHDQKKVIDSIQKTLTINEGNIFHLGLVPRDFFQEDAVFDFQVLYWEDILSAFSPIRPDDYFVNVLKLALADFNKLRSTSNTAFSTYGKNMEDKLTGSEIFERVSRGEEFWVGRSGGLAGDKLLVDKNSGGWRTFEYEVRFSGSEPPNHNWFSAARFARLMNGTAEKQQLLEPNVASNPWHFSHLGKSYFLEIANLLRLGRSLDVPIDIVYVGKKGEPYAHKKVGRSVSPNWCVRLKDGRELKYGTPTKHMVERGLWTLSNCHAFKWSEIKEYFENQVRTHP